MGIATHIHELVGEYTKKIEDCDTLIKSCSAENVAIRNGGGSHDDRSHIVRELAEIRARRQAYFQARVDIESLGDFI